jgi:hypothetical protein
MMRGCLTLLIGFLVGAGLMLVWWPQPPSGVSPPRSSDLRIVISNAYLARTVQRRVSGMRLPSVDHVRIASHPPTSLVMRVDLSLGLVSAPAALELAPVATNGHIQTQLVSSEVVGVPIPPPLAGFVTDAINRRMAVLPGLMSGQG